MPRNAIVAQRYVRALIDSRGGVKGLESCVVELKAVWQSLEKNEDLRKFFMSPIVSREAKKEAVSGLKDTVKESYEFLITLIDANRLGFLPEVIDALGRAIEESLGEMSVTVELARAASPNVLEDIRNVLQDQWRKKIKMTTEINPRLVGGFVARGPGKILDASVASQLDNLKQILSSRI